MTTVSTESSWTGIKKTTYPKLSADLAADIVIAGGGLAGVLSAYLFAKEGKSVILLEKRELGEGATLRTTAMLTESLDTDASDIIKAFGKEDAKLLVGAHRDATGLIERIVKDESIDCDFRRVSNYIYANTPKQYDELVEEAESVRDVGTKVELHKDGTDLLIKNAGYMELTDQAIFHPLKFLYALADICVEKYGVQIFEHTEVEEMEKEGESIRASAGGHHITAKWGVSATYEPLNEPLRLFFKKGMYLCYMLEVRVEGKKLVEGSYEDTDIPYHFGRIEKEGEGYRFIIGGEDHRMDIHVNEAKSFNALKEHLDTLIPEDSYTVTRRWTGHVLEPVDGIPLIGQLNDDPILYASAFSGSGMTYAGIAAKIFTEHVAGKHPRLHELYEPSRFLHLKSFALKAVDYAEEIGGGAIRNTFKESSDLDPKLESGK